MGIVSHALLCLFASRRCAHPSQGRKLRANARSVEGAGCKSTNADGANIPRRATNVLDAGGSTPEKHQSSSHESLAQQPTNQTKIGFIKPNERNQSTQHHES